MDEDEYGGDGGGGPFRPIATYDAGIPNVLEGQALNPDTYYKTWSATPDTPAGDYLQNRNDIVLDSLRSKVNNSEASTTWGLPGSQSSPFEHWGRTIDAYRLPAGSPNGTGGRWAVKTFELDEDKMKGIVEAMRGELLKNYDRLIGQGHGGEQTGALRKAVEDSKYTIVKMSDNGFEVTLTLADETGLPRSDHSIRPSTGEYGPWVFNGRRAIVTNPMFYGLAAKHGGKEFMRFKMQGRYITTMSVLPSRPFPVYNLDDEQRGKLREALKEIVSTLNGV